MSVDLTGQFLSTGALARRGAASELFLAAGKIICLSMVYQVIRFSRYTSV